MKTVSALAPDTLFFGIGAAFDFLTAAKSRAPLWMQKNGLEWLYRLGQEPGRLAGRYLVTNTGFVVKMAGALLHKEKRS
jgi:N-acetylglucosaminyldiphosphoundecaprenol N-acetyl-beta-D-mannosaminyltransferase